MLRVCEDQLRFAAFDAKYQTHGIIQARIEREKARVEKMKQKQKEALEKARIAEEAKNMPLPPSTKSNRGASASTEFAAVIIFSTLFGIWLDGEIGTKPVFFLSFMLLGMVTAFYNLYRASENLGGGKDNSQLPNDTEDATKSSKLNKNS